MSLGVSALFPLQVSVNGRVYDVGRVAHAGSDSALGVVLGLLVALVVCIVLVYVLRNHIRKRKKGETSRLSWTHRFIH